MTTYAIVQHDPFGTVYAVRHDDFGVITGSCGPLHHTETGLTVDAYEFDESDPSDLDYFNAIGTDACPNETLIHLGDLN
jgi:hypothetical protein